MKWWQSSDGGVYRKKRAPSTIAEIGVRFLFKIALPSSNTMAVSAPTGK